MQNTNGRTTEAGMSCLAGSNLDPLRISIRVTDLGLSGYAASAWLERHHRVIAELATDKVKILYMLSIPHLN